MTNSNVNLVHTLTKNVIFGEGFLVCDQDDLIHKVPSMSQQRQIHARLSAMNTTSHLGIINTSFPA